MTTGKIKWFNPAKGYGFIEQEGKDVFLHVSALEKAGIDTLQEGEEIELYGYIQHVVADKINNQRQEQFDKYNEICTWMDSHLAPKFHGCVVWKGWHAQLTTKNPKDGGRSLERGIVDMKGNIIIDSL